MHSAPLCNPVDLLRDLVGISSVSSESNRPLIALLQRFFVELRWSTRTLEYTDPNGVLKQNLIASPQPIPNGSVAAELAIVCHTDTVPYSASWTSATQLTESAPGMLHGCGACDVKGFLASLLSAASTLDPARFRKPLALVFTADEEVGCRGARHLHETGALRPRFAIVGEPTSLLPARVGKGYCLARITVGGRAAHSAYPAAGRSAILGAARLITAIDALAKVLESHRHESFDPPFTTVNIGEIRGGTAKNVVPATCSFLVEWRPIPGQSPTLFADRLRSTIAGLTVSHPGLHVDLDILRLDDGFETAADSPLLRSLVSGGPEARPITVAFGTEAPWLARMGAQTIVIGPGSMLTAHSDRECVPAIELIAAVAILRNAILELCG